MTEGLKFYTYREAAELLGISESKLHKAVAAGQMAFHRIAGGRLVRFTEDDLRTAFRPVPAMPVEGTTSRRRTPRRRSR